MPRPVNPLPKFYRGGQQVGYGTFMRHFQPRGMFGGWGQGYQQARQANVQRYEKILSRFKKLHRTTGAELEGYGAGERARIERTARESAATRGQWAVGRGLSGVTSSLTSLRGQAGVARERDVSLAGLEDRITRLRLGTLNPIRMAQLGFMERREDEYPDVGMLAGLYQRYGAAQAGAGMTPQQGRIPIMDRMAAARAAARARIRRVAGYR